MSKTNVLFIGGTFDNKGGKPSNLILSMYKELCKEKDFNITFMNGGTVAVLHEQVLPLVEHYQVVLWFANVPNDEDKFRNVKAINPKCILITSKRNDNGKYTFAELISRALAIKANLTLEFSKQEDKFNMMLFDPLGNVFYNGLDIAKLCNNLAHRTKQLINFTRVPTIQETELPTPEVPEETEFFEFAHNCADIFHNLIRPVKGTERFLGNMSFRCQNGFPSFRGDNGIVYVSRRNVDKSNINANSFVPTYLDEYLQVKYFGDTKPSVDTPVQLRLYKLFSWANYMLHAHCYVDITGIPDTLQYNTYTPVPCGAIEEVDEIWNPFVRKGYLWEACYNKQPRLIAVNLCGHGCILIAKDVEIFKELQKHKDSCFVQRPIPETI